LEADAAIRARRRERAKERRRWLFRAVVLVNLTWVGAVAVRGGPVNGQSYGGRTDLATTLGEGLAVGLSLFLLIATIGYWFSGTRPRWLEVAFGKPVLIITFVLLFLGAAGRVGSHQEAVSKATPDPNGSAIERERAHEDAVAWMKGFDAVGRDEIAAFRDIRGAISAIKRGHILQARMFNRRAERHFSEALAKARDVAVYREPDLNAGRSLMIKLLTLRKRAAHTYVKAMDLSLLHGVPLAEDRQALALLDQGDALIKRTRGPGVRLFRRVSDRYSIP
jgi:hypothetical protein